METANRSAIVHLASGVGNIVLATPLLAALGEMNVTTDICLDADYPATSELLNDWSLVRNIYCSKSPTLSLYGYVLPAIPPYYWPRFRRVYESLPNIVRRPPDSLFYRNEQGYYLDFARAIGYTGRHTPVYRLPITPSEGYGVSSSTLVITPGCKTGEMAFKRWPYFAQLSERFGDVAVVGTSDDLRDAHCHSLRFPSHVRCFVDRLSLRQTAELLASAGAVVGNDSGLSHIAGAVGTPTLILFGPTPHRTLGPFPSNVHILRVGLPCEPCWFSNRFEACGQRIDCLSQLTVDFVERQLRSLLGISG